MAITDIVDTEQTPQATSTLLERLLRDRRDLSQVAVKCLCHDNPGRKSCIICYRER